MKKKISILVIAAALATAFCFSACNGDKTAVTDNPQGGNMPAAANADEPGRS